MPLHASGASIRVPLVSRANQTEASPDQVLETARAFAERILADGACNEAYAEHKTHYVHVFLGGYPEDGFSEDEGRRLASELADLVSPSGWFVAKCHFDLYEADDADEHPDESPQTMCFVDLFPREGLNIPSPALVWHLSPVDMHDSIAAHGLEPRTGGSDHIETPEGRVYVLTDEVLAEGLALDMRRLRGWTSIDVWSIDAASLDGHRWRLDVEIPHGSAWTDLAIPCAAMQHRGSIDLREGEEALRLLAALIVPTDGTFPKRDDMEPIASF